MLALAVFGMTATAADQPTIELDCGSGVKMKLVLIPAGEFMMGSPENETGCSVDEGPRHRVKITKPFYMGEYLVTQAQYGTVMEVNPSYFEGESNPVEMVSWNDATEFCRRLSQKSGMTIRLPTEAEWEYACRAGTTTPFNTGETISTNQANYNGNYTYGNGHQGEWRRKPVAVGSFAANGFGLYDTHGNVWEWCQDWYGSYPAGEVVDPQGPATGQWRVLRGGSWNGMAADCRSAYRRRNDLALRYVYDGVGFRVVCATETPVKSATPSAGAPANEKPVDDASQYVLWWSMEIAGKEPTFVYGEMEVLSSGPNMYYCGFGWQGGFAPTSGYSGIQEHENKKRTVIFTVWDTSPNLPVSLIQAVTHPVHNRPGDAEGNNYSTSAPYFWKEGEVFRFVLNKRPQKASKNTLSTFYFFDEQLKKWVLEASLSSPPAADGRERSFTTGGYSFLEQFKGKDAGPKICLYRLWAGTAPENLVFLRRAHVEGRWGIVKGCYCLARGDVSAVIAQVPHLDVTLKAEHKEGPAILDRPLPKDIIDELKSLPVPTAAAD
jgi:formylglycine-generating enzyme required for sulfatase activity